MNPPSALHSAMGRDKKPFSYLPGGLDLSQIKSEKMAKRLMRNAMNPGVSETPIQNVHSPTTPTTHVMVPNYNCLPVQVFPSFTLPANPKSLLRTRSHPNQPRDFRTENQSFEKNNPPAVFSPQPRDFRTENQSYEKNNTPTVFSSQPRDFRTENQSFEKNNSPTVFSSQPRDFRSENQSYEKNNTPTMLTSQPRDFRTETQSYEKNNSPTVFTSQPKPEINNNIQSVSNNNNENVYNTPIANKSIHRPVSMYSAIPEYEETHLLNPISINEQSIHRGRERSLPPELKPSLMPSALCANLKNRSRSSSATREIKTSRSPEFIDSSNDINKTEENNGLHSPKTTQVTNSQNEQTSIKTTEKSSQEKKTTTTKTESTNGNADAELTVTLPSTTSVPKVDTKVDVKKNVLPDGRVQEITTTTITTTLDGKTEIRTKTETKTFPKEEYEEVEEEEDEEEEEEDGVQIEEVKQNGQESNVAQTETNGDSSALISNQETTTTVTTKKTVTQTNTNEETKQEVKQEEREEEIEEEEEEEEIEEEIVEEVEDETIQETDDKKIKETRELQKSEDVKEISGKNEPETVQEEESEEQEEEIQETEENQQVVEQKVETTSVERSEKLQSSISEQSSNVEQHNSDIEIKEKTEVSKIKEEEVEEQVVQEEVEEEQEEEEKYEEAEEEEQVKEVEQVQEAITKVSEVKEAEEQKSTNTDSFEIQATIKESFKEENRAKTITETLFSPASSDNKNDGLRDVPIKLEKVEDIEIKPIGLPTLKKTSTETTEIITSNTPASGPLSTQTELQRVENIVVQKRITTTLDRNYDELTQQGIPTAKSYFAPSREHIDLSPQPSKTFVPTYEPPSQKENRHSLLLDRLSVERQLPTFDNYQIYNTNESTESQNVLTEEPRAEVVTVSNVKPSSISNQLWFQQSEKKNEIYNNVTTSETTQEWSNQRAPSQPSLKQEMPKYQPQPEYQVPKTPQPQYQPQYQAQPEYQPQPQYQPQSQCQPQPQYQPQPEYQQPSQPQYQPQYEHPAKTTYQNPPQQQTQYNTLPKTQYQYQPKPQYQNQSQYQSKETHTESQNYQRPSFVKAGSYTDNYSSAYPSTDSYQQSYTNLNNNTSNQSSTSPWIENSYGNIVQNSNTQTNQYSFKDNNASYQQETQNYPSSYVPPPWEQDSSYVYENNNSTWQSTAPSLSNELPSWQPKQPKAKVAKPQPTAYIPPAPNQSFVKPVSKSDILPKQPGRKTYYSEYERRYISVPETTYVPSENKEIHTQVDSTAQYYYDNDEPVEKEEPVWRKELREFSEKKISTSYVPEQFNEKKFTPSYGAEQLTMSNQPPLTQSVKPPWEPEVVYEKVPTSAQYTSTPTWSQTLKPRSSRETSFETDYVSQEWPRNNSISRGRPLSSYNTISTTQRSERSRGVSVDRYNANSYHSPIPTEHPPVQSHTLTPLTAPQHKIHNRQSRASAEPRELSAQNPRMWGDSRLRERENPIQSRSFKYLQWITGTDE